MNKIKKPHEIKVQQKIKALVYGQPGLGKTTFALSAPTPVLLDFDNGVHRVRAEHQTPTLQVESWKDVVDVLEDGSLNQFKTIIIDTAGKMIDYMSDDIMSKNPKMKRGNGALTLQGYGERKAMFSQFLKKITLMGKHLLFVAHEKEDKQNEETKLRPEVGGSSGNDLFKELDLIGYMEANGKKRTISFHPTDKYYAKNGIGLNEVMELPDLKDGEPNVFFEKQILDVYSKNLENRKIKADKYKELQDLIEGKIEAIENEETANEVLKWNEDFKEHIWSSKMFCKTKLWEKSKGIDLEFDKKEKKFIKKEEEKTEAEKTKSDQYEY